MKSWVRSGQFGLVAAGFLAIGAPRNGAVAAGFSPLAERLYDARAKLLADLPKPPLLRFALSPERPKQGDSVTVFISTTTSFSSPDPVRVFLSAKLDNANVELSHPTSSLWVLRAGPFDQVASHELKASVVIEDQSETESIRRSITRLNSDILRLEAAIAAEKDPVRKKQLQAERRAKQDERHELEQALQDLRNPIGHETFSFRVASNSDPGSTFPVIASSDPNFGPAAGGTTVTLRGLRFGGAHDEPVEVFFGGVPATEAHIVDAQTIVAVTPAQTSPGTKDIEARFAGRKGANAVLSNGFFATSGGSGTTGNLHPVAFAGFPQERRITGSAVALDGSLSYDDNADPLTYAWAFVSKPGGSALTDADIHPGTENPATATFTPDVSGTYILSLVVFDGLVFSVPSLTTVSAIRPVEILLSTYAMDLSARVGQGAGGGVEVCNHSDTETLVITSVTELGDTNDELTLSGELFQDTADDPANPGGGPGPNLPFNLQPGQCTGVSVQFAPQSVGTGSRAFAVVFSGRNSRLVSARLDIAAQARAPYPLRFFERFNNFTAPLDPIELYPNRTPTDIPGVPLEGVFVPGVVDQDALFDIHIANGSDDPITIPSLPEVEDFGGGLAISPDFTPPVMVPAHGEITVPFRVSAAAPFGPEGVMNHVRWDIGLDPMDPPVEFLLNTVRGEEFQSQEFNFPATSSGSSVSETRSIGQNFFQGPFSGLFEVTAIAITGTDAAQFSYRLDPGVTSFPYFFIANVVCVACANLGIPGPYFPVTITFHPDQAGDFNAALDVTLASSSRHYTASLRGSAVRSGGRR